ncbi:MAG TPA: GerMN domain-containing protein [Roseiflexaceae bacterium]|nr:GerMN domain-containing protein [Roseiflexaceae bacterium]
MISLRHFTHWVAAGALALLLPVAGQAAQAGADIAEPFRDYYAQHQGIRVLGYPLSDLREVDGYAAQYFEKGRIEDHRRDLADPAWVFMFGRLTDELMSRDAGGAVSATDVTYGSLAAAHRPSRRVAIPTGFAGGTMTVRTGEFIPYDAFLRPAPGYVVPLHFWSYMQRADLFPGGWLHDIGLPMTDAFQASVVKNGQRRTISMQAFERTVLTYDPRNPRDWQIERANIGADALRTLPAPAPAGPIAIPEPGARMTLPLHILAHLGQPGGQMIARLRWQDGTELMRVLPVLRGADGRGLLIGTLNWMNEGPPPQPATQPATLEVLSASGELQARQSIVALSASDPDTQLIRLYWVLGETVTPVQQRVPRTARIGTAALNELLWGPGPPNLAGFSTALPTPEEVLRYPGREPDWGERVTLQSLTIADGVATADFSQELRAYGGGSLRVMLIRQQITQTLLQFPTVREVRITIEGQSEGVLEP